MAHFYLQGLLLRVLLIVISECRGISPVIETVSSSQEEDVALPCFHSNVMDQKSCYRVKWIKCATDARQMKVILARPKTPKFQDAERVKWQADGNGQMSLFLTKLQKSDEGLYSCEIWEGWDCILVKNVSLKVKECKALHAVKVAPSTAVNLTCPVDIKSGQGPQNIFWEMLKGGNPVPVNSKRVEISGTLLAIQSVNYSDSGWYRCKYMLGQSQRCFDINLLIQVGNAVVATTASALATSEIIWKSRKEGSSEAFIAVVTFVIIAVAALIGPIIYRRRNTRRVAHQTQSHRAGMESFDGYETVNLTPYVDPANSIYKQDESLCTS